MKKLLIIIVLGIIVSKHSSYKVVSNNNGHLTVDRKGKMLNFYDKSFKGDSITLWADYDINYNNLK